MSISIKILGTGCPKCNSTVKLVKEVVDENHISAIVIKIDDTNFQATLAYLKSEWKKLFPHLPFNNFFQEKIPVRAVRFPVSRSTCVRKF